MLMLEDVILSRIFITSRAGSNYVIAIVIDYSKML